MAHDELLRRILEVRIRAALGTLPGLVEKKMFGGVGFLVNGNIAYEVHKNELVVRVGPEKYAEALTQPHTRPFDMTVRPMTGWNEVEPPGCATERALKDWVELGVAFVMSQPGKSG